MSGANTSALELMYPRNFIAPDGRVFGYDSNGQMYYVEHDRQRLDHDARPVRHRVQRRRYASAAMFRPGRILQFGGNSNGALSIDITGAAPVVTHDADDVVHARLVNATVLADGKVLATGGSAVSGTS